MPNIRNFWPQRADYLIPMEFMRMIISRLEIEDRRIDQINGGEGSLAKAMAKECMEMKMNTLQGMCCKKMVIF